ncbi:MAG: MlaE family lipid ABC transporter permease subunit [Gammaproteobacteria bacterium]
MHHRDALAEIDWNADRIRCRGRWTVDALGAVTQRCEQLRGPDAGAVTVDGSGVTALDTAGAWLLQRLRLRLEAEGRAVSVEGLSAPFADLYQRVAELGTAEPPREHPLGHLATIGHRTLNGLEELYAFLSFFGAVMTRIGYLALHPWRVRWRSIWVDLHVSGVTALGIVGLLSFLMGVVFAYQGAVQLRTFGASIYIADLVGLSMTRELGPLLAAIIVAGRTGSAYTAQIGTMKVTEEISALRTIGIEPMDLLVIPKVLALCVALPLLAVFADLMGILGGMILAKLQMGLGFTPFLDRLNEAVSLQSFVIGISKAPVFALIIAMIGCFQGFRVQGSAASVGHHTTLSVVQSIFLVIVADAQFSVVFSWLGI